jgi:hypothetical protein
VNETSEVALAAKSKSKGRNNGKRMMEVTLTSQVNHLLQVCPSSLRKGRTLWGLLEGGPNPITAWNVQTEGYWS